MRDESVRHVGVWWGDGIGQWLYERVTGRGKILQLKQLRGHTQLSVEQRLWPCGQWGWRCVGTRGQEPLTLLWVLQGMSQLLLESGNCSGMGLHSFSFSRCHLPIILFINITFSFSVLDLIQFYSTYIICTYCSHKISYLKEVQKFLPRPQLKSNLSRQFISLSNHVIILSKSVSLAISGIDYY